MSHHCITCNRSFVSNASLKQHKKTADVHNFICTPCDQRFNSEDALQQHLRDSPAHTSFTCGDCNRTFKSDKSLQKHLQNSATHQMPRQTPLDIFFQSFPGFDYDPSLPPAISFANLRKHKRWHRDSVASNEAWDDYQDALQSELYMWYGAESDLTAWHALCRAIGVKPLPTTCEQCEKAARRTHVNIIDLIEYGRSGSKESVKTFPNVNSLRVYTKLTGKVFRNTFDRDSGNVVLRHLLRKIF